LKKKVILSVVSSAMLFTGCWNHTEVDANTSVTKIFKDSVVVGLPYKCFSTDVEHVTDNNGKFTCNIGDNVTFYAGQITLGSIVASEVQNETISPYDLADTKEKVLNIAQLLQTLDDDGDVSEMIKIDSEKLSLLDKNISIDSSTFDNDVNRLLGADGISLVREDEASTHLYDNIPDTIAPIVHLIGESQLTVDLTSTYIDAGATAEDDRDGMLTPVKSGTVNTENSGTYTIIWTATDSAGNVGTAQRTITVSSETPSTQCQNVNPITGQCEDTPTVPPVDNQCQNVNPITGQCEDTPTVPSVDNQCQNVNPITGQCEDTPTVPPVDNQCQNVNPITGSCED